MKRGSKVKHLSFVAMLMLWCAFDVWAQEINFGIPEIYNFDRETYNGGTQTWDIISTENNRILVANNEGLLEFDGHKWEKYSLPNKTILRSIAYDSASKKIYVGGQDELGYFQPDKFGILKYHNIKHTIPLALNNLEDIWNLKLLHGTLYFRSVNRIYAYNGSQWKVFLTKESTRLTQIGNNMVYNDTEKGLFKIVDGNAVFIEGSEIVINKPLTNIITLKDHWYILTEKHGLIQFFEHKWQILDTYESNFLKNNRVHSACRINDSLIAVGTYLKGVILLDNKGKIKMSINHEKGLQNNTIASLYYSPTNHLWVGTYKGIDMVDLGSVFTNIYPDGTLQGSVYASIIHNNKLYCGTENGLYFRELGKDTLQQHTAESSFQLVKGTEGQVWGLDVIFGDLMMSHNDGAFIINGNKATKISTYNGSWKFLEFDNDNYCIGGAYSGLFLFKKTDNKWEQVGKIAGFDESCRIMVKHATYLWVSHPYRGLFRLDINIDNLTASIENYEKKEGLPGYLRNIVYNVENEIVASTEQGLYKFDMPNNKFVKMKLPIATENNLSQYKVFLEHQNSVWLATDQHFGFIQYEKKFFNSKNYEKKLLELKNGLVPGFEKIYPLNNREALLLTTKGIKYFKNQNKPQTPLYAYISKIYDINKQNVVTQGYHSSNAQQNYNITFDHKSNAFLFNFSSSACSQDIKYSHLLTPTQKQWSNWENKSSKEINNLPPGKYQLQLKATDIHGRVSPVYTYSFQIFPPWYQTKTAITFYAILVIFLLLYSRQRLVNKYEQITTNLEEQKNESEALVFQLQNEKLEAEIRYKNKELGLSTMHIVQKNEAINKLKTELNKIIKKINDPQIKREIKSMVSILSDDERLNEDWEAFAKNFDAIHNDFLTRLKTKFPQLSPRDLKLCAYLKLNLTSKDLAPLLNISVRGVEISRYRLRKKLDLPNDTNLNDYMMNI